MKRIVNICATVFLIGLLKGCIISPVYLCFAPIVTAVRWRGHLCNAIRFELGCVWHTLCNDWHDGCEAMVYNLV